MALYAIPISLWHTRPFAYITTRYIRGVKSEVESAMKNTPKRVHQLIGAIFLLLALYNTLALAPLFFSATSHLAVCLPIAYSIWVGIVVFRWVKSFSDFLSHLVPSGTPVILIRFMVLVELLRNLIRPMALTFRLTANIIAGHLLMCLTGRALVRRGAAVILAGGAMQIILVTIEMGVSLIQAYVFTTLLTLYTSERCN